MILQSFLVPSQTRVAAGSPTARPSWATCFRRGGWHSLNCARRTSTFLLRVPRAQRLASRLAPPILRPLVARAQEPRSPDPDLHPIHPLQGSGQIVLHCAHRESNSTLPPDLLYQPPPRAAPMPVLLRPSSEVTDDPSKLARFLFRDGD